MLLSYDYLHLVSFSGFSQLNTKCSIILHVNYVLHMVLKTKQQTVFVFVALDKCQYVARKLETMFADGLGDSNTIRKTTTLTTITR